MGCKSSSEVHLDEDFQPLTLEDVNEKIVYDTAHKMAKKAINLFGDNEDAQFNGLTEPISVPRTEKQINLLLFFACQEAPKTFPLPIIVPAEGFHTKTGKQWLKDNAFNKSKNRKGYEEAID